MCAKLQLIHQRQAGSVSTTDASCQFQKSALLHGLTRCRIGVDEARNFDIGSQHGVYCAALPERHEPCREMPQILMTWQINLPDTLPQKSRQCTKALTFTDARQSREHEIGQCGGAPWAGAVG